MNDSASLGIAQLTPPVGHLVRYKPSGTRQGGGMAMLIASSLMRASSPKLGLIVCSLSRKVPGWD